MASPETEMLVIAVPAAVVGAASFGLASAMQQRATKQVPTATAMDPRLLWNLVRQPTWVLGVGTVVVGFSLQVVALAFGPLVLVQPLLVTGVLFGTVFSAMLARRRLDRQILLGASACVVGLAAFLTLARPTGASSGMVGLSGLAPLAVLLSLIIVGCLVVAVGSRFSGSVHVAALALATGVLYGVTAGLMKVVTSQLRAGGLPEVFGHPAIYVICLLGPMGFLLSQNTFQQGVLIAPALAIITIVDPLVGYAIGLSWLGEEVTTSVPILVGEAMAAAVVVAGIALLARRGTQIRHKLEYAAVQQGAERHAAPHWG
jgi:drug/metabolite transporter (DMT)-like permease